MNKNAIQKFAIWARKELIAQVSQRAYQYGIDESGFGDASADTLNGRLLTAEEKSQRQELIKQIQEKGYKQVMEEVAYTWFNRFIALRFMEVNNYLPSHIRVFSDSTGAFKPEILSDVLHLELPGLSREKVAEYIESNDTEGLYRYLLLTQCNALNDPLPRMFEKMGGYTELLLPNNILKQDSVLGHMVADIPEEDWTDQVQIIGWLYQYYNSELKDDTFALLKKNVKITKERIPSATQLFTPDWIVRYMVENSLGRLWLEGHPNAELHDGWKYYLDEAEQEPEVEAQLAKLREEYKIIKPEEIKVIDPCMGSGHILVYAFDVLMQIYTSAGWDQREAAQSILKNNLYGLDIDDRAAQLAYFAVMMKARQYDRRIFSRGIQPHVYAIVESNGLDRSTIDYFTNNDPKLQKDFGTLMEELRDAKEYGSILNISQVDFAALYARIEEVRDDISIFREVVLSSILPLIRVAEVMAQKYDVVVTNPPYMNNSGMTSSLSGYLGKHYPDTRSDLSTVFMEKTLKMCKKNGHMAMINIPVWMFITSYKKLRENIISQKSIVNMLHLGRGVFGSDFGTTSFVILNAKVPEHNAKFKKLYLRQGEVDSVEEKERMFFSQIGDYISKQDSFSAIPDSPIAYWASNELLYDFSIGKLVSKYAQPRQGMSTCDVNRFTKLWYEVKVSDTNIFKEENIAKWVRYNKGGSFRKWYGNKEYVVYWGGDGSALLENGALLRNREAYFKPFIAWTKISSAGTGFRKFEDNYLFDGAGGSLFLASSAITEEYLLGLLNSKVNTLILNLISPTLNFNENHIGSIPVIESENEHEKARIKELVSDAVRLAQQDWDSFETSWDFMTHPLVRCKSFSPEEVAKDAMFHIKDMNFISEAFTNWSNECYLRFSKLKANEEELNRIFIDIYGLQDELTPDVADKDITVHRVFDSKDGVPESMKGSNYVRTMRDEIVSLISYAVGCMFGRYSLDVDGLAYAGGEWDESRYKTIVPDSDNIIPICDDEYFDDDITGRFVKWVETVYGSETLEENLKFVADALGGKGTPREVIRSYFLNDFYADHLKTCQKRPIYWLFDSGKKNGFKALIYMHRYQSDLLARMRTDYVHEQQERYRTQLTHLADAIEHAGAAERVKLTKQQKKLQEQALEIQKYEEKVHHLADQNIQIDLDDGVKHNYELFADVLAKIK